MWNYASRLEIRCVFFASKNTSIVHKFWGFLGVLHINILTFLGGLHLPLFGLREIAGANLLRSRFPLEKKNIFKRLLVLPPPPFPPTPLVLYLRIFCKV